jgi:hypothetical protein
MTSLLQFKGNLRRNRVGLLFYLVGQHLKWDMLDFEPLEEVACTVCADRHAQLYEVFRKPLGLFGQFVVFRYNGEEHVPDLSIPIRIDKIPRGGRRLSLEENSQAWHKESR